MWLPGSYPRYLDEVSVTHSAYLGLMRAPTSDQTPSVELKVRTGCLWHLVVSNSIADRLLWLSV